MLNLFRICVLDVYTTIAAVKNNIITSLDVREQLQCSTSMLKGSSVLINIIIKRLLIPELQEGVFKLWIIY